MSREQTSYRLTGRAPYKETTACISVTLRDVYDPIADQTIPFRFGKVLGELFMATTDLTALGSTGVIKLSDLRTRI